MIKSNKYEDNLSAANSSSVNVRDGLTFLLVGGGIGAVLALLFAPKSGREMRHDIADASRRGYDLTLEKATELKSQSAEKLQMVKEKAEAAYDFAAAKLNTGGEAVSEAVSTTSAAISDGLDKVHRKADIRAGNASDGRKPANIL